MMTSEEFVPINLLTSLIKSNRSQRMTSEGYSEELLSIISGYEHILWNKRQKTEQLSPI